MLGKMLLAFNYADAVRGETPDADFADPDALGNGTDWQDLLFPGGSMYNAHVNISGGSEKATYSVSLDYFDEKGVVPSTFYKRYSFRNNLDFELSKKIKVGTSMSWFEMVEKEPLSMETDPKIVFY